MFGKDEVWPPNFSGVSLAEAHSELSTHGSSLLATDEWADEPKPRPQPALSPAAHPGGSQSPCPRFASEQSPLFARSTEDGGTVVVKVFMFRDSSDASVAIHTSSRRACWLLYLINARQMCDFPYTVAAVPGRPPHEAFGKVCFRVLNHG